MIELDLETLDRAELVQLRDRLNDELRRRDVIASTQTVISQQLEEYRRAIGREDGMPYRPYDGTPASMYGKGEITTHKGKVWQSNIDGNVWEPGVSDTWTELTGGAPKPDPITAAPWGPNQTVSAGDLREHEGAIYRAVQQHTTQTGWEPPLVPALWSLIQEAQ